MNRLVVASNRVASMKNPAQEGGLAVALLDTLRRSGGVWFGWSGEISEAERKARWRTLIEGVRRDDVTAWRESFLERLYAMR